MSQIDGVSRQQGVSKITPTPIQRTIPTDAPKQLRLTDKVELSGLGYLLQSLKSNDIRADKVAAIKAQIEAGTYEDDQKLDAAIDKLLDDLDR
jgi:anti-sigma28 factor (negative regulator of flagellin synthesis)